MNKRVPRLLPVLLLIAAALAAYVAWSARAPGETAPGTAEAGPSPSGAAAHRASGEERVVVLYTNDLHGAVEPEKRGNTTAGGLVNLVSLIGRVRAEDPERTLLLDAGDTFQGSYVSNSTQGSLVLDLMNVAGYDAWTLGNHEFDWGLDTLRARIAQAHFPTLAANLFDAATGQPWDAVTPYAILQAGDAEVAVLGLTYPSTPSINKPQNVKGLDFRGAEEAVRHTLPELEGQADLIVVLSHLGIDGDRALARSVDGIDLIVGGHSHTALDRPEEVDGTLIVQAAAKGQALGRLELTVDLATDRVTDHSSGDLLLPVEGEVRPVNQQARALVEAALAEAKEATRRPVGETVRALGTQRSGEFALGNLVVDAMREIGVGDGRAAAVAFHNNGGIRAGLPAGPVTYGQLYAVLPFDNQLIAMDLTGSQVLRILEHSVSGSGPSLQVSGLSFRFDASRPVGQRVREAVVGGRPLEPERTYRAVTIDYLALGGDGFDTFEDGANLTYGDGEVWAVAEYLRAHSPVDPRVDGRIR